MTRMCFVQTTTNLRLITRLRGRQDSREQGESGKRKFGGHADVKQSNQLRLRKAAAWQLDNGKTFPPRQVKAKLLRISCIFVVCCVQGVPGAENADTIFRNGNVYTVND